MHACISCIPCIPCTSFQHIFKGSKQPNCKYFRIMDIGRRSTKKFNFISPNLGELKKLVSQIADPAGFLSRYGRISSLLSAKMEDGLLSTLIQFYDPIYHCFTFPDYQLMPTLEEYSQIRNIQIADSVPFSGSEEMPRLQWSQRLMSLTHSDIAWYNR